jgi:undecaprenyl-diphosphatase
MIEKLLSIDKTWLRGLNHFANSASGWQRIFEFFGIYLIYAVPVMLVLLWFWSAPAKKIVLRAAFSGLLAWLVVANIFGRIINRPRPFETNGIHEFVFHQPTYSFPSDHATFLFALGFSFYLSGYKKLSFGVLIMATLMAIARMGLGFHYPSDLAAGAILGVVIAWIIWLFDRPLNYLYNLLIVVAKKLRLA